jgi:hypothetical protein
LLLDAIEPSTVEPETLMRHSLTLAGSA